MPGAWRQRCAARGHVRHRAVGPRERALWLARDRLGEKPLYYGWQGDTFLFGSELKALRAHPAFHATVDRGALSLLLRHNYVPAPYSIYTGIHKLPAGTWLKLREGAARSTPVAYWSLAEVAERGMAQPFTGSDAEALDALDTLLGKAVRGQMVADVPLGALLSGGIDSTVVGADAGQQPAAGAHLHHRLRRTRLRRGGACTCGGRSTWAPTTPSCG